jgi:hypothetical protein
MADNTKRFMAKEKWLVSGTFCAGGGKHPAYRKKK